MIENTCEDVCRLYVNTMPFYIRNSSVCEFRYFKMLLEPIHTDSEGQLDREKSEDG